MVILGHFQGMTGLKMGLRIENIGVTLFMDGF